MHVLSKNYHLGVSYCCIHRVYLSLWTLKKNAFQNYKHSGQKVILHMNLVTFGLQPLSRSVLRQILTGTTLVTMCDIGELSWGQDLRVAALTSICTCLGLSHVFGSPGFMVRAGIILTPLRAPRHRRQLVVVPVTTRVTTNSTDIGGGLIVGYNVTDLKFIDWNFELILNFEFCHFADDPVASLTVNLFSSWWIFHLLWIVYRLILRYARGKLEVGCDVSF